MYETPEAPATRPASLARSAQLQSGHVLTLQAIRTWDNHQLSLLGVDELRQLAKAAGDLEIRATLALDIAIADEESRRR